MMGLSDGRKSFPIGLARLIQYRSVTASHPATQPPASHVAVAITLNAKASSLKMENAITVKAIVIRSYRYIKFCEQVKKIEMKFFLWLAGLGSDILRHRLQENTQQVVSCAIVACN